MTKRIICAVMAAAMLLSLFFALLPAARGEVYASGDCGEELQWVLEEGVLTISGNGPMEDFEEQAPWYEYRDSIEKVVLSGGVTTVGANAFRDYDAITEVDFGEALNMLGAGSFASCGGLTRLHLPKTFRIFGEESLRGCPNLKAIHCEGPFPSFKLNCLWDTYTKIYFPVNSPWPVSLIQQLEEAFQGRIEFLASDGTDPYVPEEATQATETTTAPETVPETTAVTVPTTEAVTEPTSVSTTAPTTVPTTAPTTEPPTQWTQATAPLETQPAQEKTRSGGAVVGLALVGFVLSAGGIGALIFRRPRKSKKKGKYCR